jgi:Tfp pilus assembly pilus retraction ATPase PilT
MNTLEQCLIRLMNEGLISRSTALAAAGNPKAIAMSGLTPAEA